MEQKKINREVNRITRFIKRQGTDIEAKSIIVLDMQKGFLFYNYAKGLIYTGVAIMQPDYESGAIKRNPEVINYITGKDENGNFILHEDRSLEDLRKLYKEILEG